ncbi:hypothetical protein PsorP6_011286 [Peronosclerospora sorghi]|uniref:Uncharacterized protein n=1 Tax=Peronosclerospora sorghi TaxID=230839 RepID=A0ACC0WIT8_9STRA|nr:hypothetical protein PsorP6_011286 [Peronosclerospora sorghi]
MLVSISSSSWLLDDGMGSTSLFGWSDLKSSESVVPSSAMGVSDVELEDLLDRICAIVHVAVIVVADVDSTREESYFAGKKAHHTAHEVRDHRNGCEALCGRQERNLDWRTLYKKQRHCGTLD